MGGSGGVGGGVPFLVLNWARTERQATLFVPRSSSSRLICSSSLAPQAFSRVAALAAGHPALPALQGHDAAHRQEEPG